MVIRIVAAVLVLSAWVPRIATADDDVPPWSRGVSLEERAAAEKLLAEGNELLYQKKYREAIKTFSKALEHWDHPAIRFNLARTYISLDEAIVALKHLEKSLEYGAAPFDEGVYADALNYQSLLRKQISELTISCAQTEVKISLDGKPLLNCPGKKTLLVEPGRHEVVGTRSGFFTKTEQVTALPGKPMTTDIKLLALADATVTERRWSAWKPWTVVAGGAVVAGVGVYFFSRANSNMDEYRSRVAAEVEAAGNMPIDVADLDSSISDYQSRSELQSKIAVSLWAVGGAALLAGGTLVYLNRERAVIRENPGQTAAVAPVVRSDFAGLTWLTPF